MFHNPYFDNHEQVVFTADEASGLRALIAIHNTARGPALGGCRVWTYASEDAALADALRLSRGMTYKSAIAELPLGGGKSVILLPKDGRKTPQMFRALGRTIEPFAGRGHAGCRRSNQRGGGRRMRMAEDDVLERELSEQAADEEPVPRRAGAAA